MGTEEKIVTVAADKVTRERLRAMRSRTAIVVQCENGAALESQKNNAYNFAKVEGCRFACKVDGLTLTVTRYDND